ncbi:DISARM system phospholipase D-like protein DrmC [Streptomyces sp. NPDC057654]|uniref:DISARM system phospholipase D-like protein DrmC n=1 Tax=Streptomyces sp. NPDC057654 TaxID=3346196 RepID=UPI0036B39120
MSRAAFREAAAQARTAVGTQAVRALAEGIAEGRTRAALLSLRSVPGFAEAAAAVVDAVTADRIPAREAAAYLEGLAEGHALRAAEQQVSLVWSGPSSHRVPVRSTGLALLELIDKSRRELLLMSYSAKPYPPLVRALTAAAQRAVIIDVVVETLEGAGSALAGAEPASAFTGVPGIRIWHWPVGRRRDPGAKTHAKLAVADSRILLVTSANFTQSGVDRNIEAGALIRGGTTPSRTAEHVRELQREGTLQRFH